MFKEEFTGKNGSYSFVKRDCIPVLLLQNAHPPPVSLSLIDKVKFILSLKVFADIVLDGSTSDNNHPGSSALLSWPMVPTSVLVK